MCESLNYNITMVSRIIVFLILYAATTFGDHDQANNKIIMCYYGSWATYRPDYGKFDVENIHPELCTHLVYTFAGLNQNGTVAFLDPYLDLPDNWGRDNIGKFNSLKLQNPKLITLLAVGGWNEGSAKYSNMANSAALRKIFVEDAKNTLLKYKFDGLDLDWEYPNRRDTVHGQADVENFVQLLKELREEFDKHNLLLTAAVSATPNTATLSYNIPAISKYLDIIGLMTYDFYGAWDAMTGYNSALHKSDGYGNVPRETIYTVDVAVEYWLSQGCPADKIVLGLPFYGHTFTLVDSSVSTVRAPSSGPGFAGPWTRQAGLIGYTEFCLQLKNEQWDVHYDDKAKVPYAVQNKNWVSYDDMDSHANKIAYSLKYGIAGVMVWSIETDDFHALCHDEDYPLLRNINKAFSQYAEGSTTSTSSGIESSSFSTSSSIDTSSSSTSSTSTTSSPTSPFICKEEGITSNPDNCSSFYYCLFDINGNLIPQLFHCPGDLYYDDNYKICNYPDLVHCKD